MKSTNKVKFKECDVYCAQSFWHVWHGVKWYGIATSTPIHIQPISTYLWIQFPFEPIFIDCFRFLLFQVFPLTFTDEPVYLLFMQSRRRRQRQHDDCCMPISHSLSTFRCHLMSIILKLFVYAHISSFKSNNHWNMIHIFNFQNVCTSECDIDCDNNGVQRRKICC